MSFTFADVWENVSPCFYISFFADSKETNVTFGILDHGQGTDGRQLVGYWARFDRVRASGAHAPFDVVVVMDLNDRDQIDVPHVVMVTTFIRGIFEKETGRPFTGVHIRIVDEDNNDVKAGEVGEIIARSKSIMVGYWHKPDETR